jgi:hypothetical protein
VLVVEGGPPAAQHDAEEALRMARQLVSEGVPKREAARRVRALAGGKVSAREIYEHLVASSS